MSKITEYIDIVDCIQSGKPVKVAPTVHTTPTPPNKLCTIVDGKITELCINQSFIKQVYWTGPSTEYIGTWDMRPDVCPSRIYNIDITHKYRYPQTTAMLLGTFFESKAIGSGAYGKCNSLPRNTRTGEIKKHEERILDAVSRFQLFAEESGIIIDNQNTQVEKKIPVFDNDYPDIKISLKVIADLISPIYYENMNYDIAILDLKLTSDRNSDFFKSKQPWNSFCWGTPSLMSSLQGTMYSYVFDLCFVNIVFDYKLRDPGFSVIPVKTIVSHSDDQEAKLRHNEMQQGIKKLIGQMVEWNDQGWATRPGGHCAKCPLADTCPARKTINYI